MRALLDGAVERLDDETFARSMGEMLTSGGEPSAPERGAITGRALTKRLRAGATLRRSVGTQAAFVRRPRRVLLFVNGRTIALPPTLADAAALLTGPRTVPPKDIRRALGQSGFAAVAAELVSEGSFAIVRPGADDRGRP
jgi:hypothetical protein